MRLTSALPGVGDWTQPEEDAPERVIWKKTEDQEGEENAALSQRLNKCRFGSALTLAEVLELPGALAYGNSQDEAMAKTEVLALRVLAKRLEHGEVRPIAINISLSAAA